MRSRSRRNLIALVLLLAVAAATAATVYHRHARQSAREAARSALRAVARARADEIERWRAARRQELRVHAAGILRIYVQPGLGLPGNLAEDQKLLAELKNTQETEGYLNLMVASPEGRLLLSTDPSVAALDAEARQVVASVLSSGAAVHGRIFPCTTCGKLAVDDAVPIPDEQGRAVAVLIQRTAPEEELLPLLSAWQLPGRGIVTVLARRDGDSVLVLNSPLPDSPEVMAQRWPLSHTGLPAVQAALGHPGPLEGRDERGVEALAETVAIADAPWFVVATIGGAEVDTQVAAESRLILALVVLAMLFVGAMGELAHRIRRQKMADRMRTSEAFNRTIVESIPQRLFLKDRDSIYLVVNRAYASSLGLSPDEMIGRDDFTYFPRELAEKYRADDREVMSSGHLKDLEENYQAGGETSVIHTVKVPIRDDEGRVFAVLGLFEDITERKMAELLLRARVTLHAFERGHSLGELLQKTLDEAEALTGSTIGFFHFLDAEQETLTLQAWSTRTEAEYCRAGKGTHDPIDRAGVWVDCVRERRPVIHNDYASLPHRRGLPEGHAPLVRELVVPIARDDRIVAVLGVGNKPVDYTDLDVRTVSFLADVAWEIALHKRSEEALRSAEAARVQLEAAARHKQKLESIGTLASGVAHEINNPLNVILNYGQLLVDAPDDPAVVRDFAGNIVKESGRVATIVRNLLSFARQDKESHSPARIADIVERTLSLMHAQFRKDRIEVACAIPDDLPSVPCRTQQIQQVLMNLLTNARDALNQKYPDADADKAIRISAERFERDGEPWIRVSLEDHGPGIPADVAERIFDPFFTTKPRDQGTGLGLSISYGILREHRGELRFESRLGIGTVFHVELPLAGGSARASQDTTKT